MSFCHSDDLTKVWGLKFQFKYFNAHENLNVKIDKKIHIITVIFIISYLQKNGNLAIYSKSRALLWQLGYSGHHSGTRLLLEDIGNVIYQDLASNTIIWQTDTKCRSKCR